MSKQSYQITYYLGIDYKYSMNIAPSLDEHLLRMSMEQNGGHRIYGLDRTSINEIKGSTFYCFIDMDDPEEFFWIMNMRRIRNWCRKAKEVIICFKQYDMSNVSRKHWEDMPDNLCVIGCHDCSFNSIYVTTCRCVLRKKAFNIIDDCPTHYHIELDDIIKYENSGEYEKAYFLLCDEFCGVTPYTTWWIKEYLKIDDEEKAYEIIDKGQKIRRGELPLPDGIRVRHTW